jgi:hypothetical protein
MDSNRERPLYQGPIHKLCKVPCPTPSLSLLTLPARPLQAASGHPGGAGGMAKGVRLGGPRRGGLGGGLVWRPGVLPLFAEDEEGRQG